MTTAEPVPRLRRRSGGKIIGGVAGGIADHLDVEVFRVRVVFVVLTALAGAGVMAYGALWFFCPPGDDTQRPSKSERRQAYGLVLIGLVALGVSALFASNTPAQDGVALLFVVGGAALVWREFDVTGLGSRRSALTWVRVGIGAVLVVGGLLIAVVLGDARFGDTRLGGLGSTIFAVVATLVGVVLLTVPLWMRLLRTLDAERAARIRTAEREEIASHLHDSVLQTLALIQKRSGDPETVARLARRQERELRTWLFGDHADRRESLAAAISAVAVEVEESYGTEIEAVTVGDTSPEQVRDETQQRALRALVAATREALVNAAKHSGAPKVDLYCEVTDDRAEVFVRDRGTGFDVDAVDDDRQGIVGSIRGRMERAGGTAQVQSTPGRGTNVTLCISLDDGGRRVERGEPEHGEAGHEEPGHDESEQEQEQEQGQEREVS
ncbi:MAG: PspC domain-containing protein [Gordonia sp. (in: high G+C Gram-positive bacteria)]